MCYLIATHESGEKMVCALQYVFLTITVISFERLRAARAHENSIDEYSTTREGCMISVERVIFPGIIAGCLFLVFFTNLIARPNIAQASTGKAESQLAAAVYGLPDATIATVGNNLPPAADLSLAQETAPVQATEPAAAEQPAAAQPECTLSSTYPHAVRQWCGLIETYSAKNGLDANLVAAVIVQESAGDPNAYSKSGAVGLMQVMPRDGLAAGFMCINGPCFASRPTSRELFDPEFNISYGTRMLADLIQRHGNVRDALRAYGPMDMGYRYADLVLSIAARHQQ